MEEETSEKYLVKETDDEQVASINDNEEEHFIFKKKDKKKRNKLPFLVYILIFTFIVFLISVIIYCIVNNEYIENYKEYKDDIYLKPSISEHNYSKLVFDNGLEIVLTQVHYEDKAGGAITFEKGYLDPEYEPGYLELAFYSLRNTDRDLSIFIRNYMGDLRKSSEEFYSTIYFNILNSGFQYYLKNFGEYLSLEIDNETIPQLIRNGSRRMENLYFLLSNVDEREKHLIEYLVYNIKDKDGNDIWRQGNRSDILNKLNGSYDKIIDIMNDLFDPMKIKLIFYTHYKMSLMKKFILKYLESITKKENKNNNNKDTKPYTSLNTSKIIYHLIERNESNYMKINYYISNNNASLDELYIDSGYFNYLKYILDETHNESLYYILTHPINDTIRNITDLNIKSLSCDFEVILKNKIRFSILIKLNKYSYRYLKEILEIVYNHMEKVKMHIQNIDANDKRASELYTINGQNFTFAEDVHLGEYYKNKAKDLFYKDNHDYFLKEVWVPPNLHKNSTKIKYYINQLTLENSVVIVGINKYTIDKYNLNSSDFDLSFIFDDLAITSNTSNYSYTYSIDDLSQITITNNINEEYKLAYYKNKFISKYTKHIPMPKIEFTKNIQYNSIETDNDFIKFYWLKNTNFQLPKVYMNLYLFHPFLRPNCPSEIEKDKLFFYMMIYISYIQREINLVLSDAIRAGNIFRLNYTESYFYIDIFAFSDVLKDILEVIKEKIICNKENIITKDNFVIYRDYALKELLHFDRVDIRDIIKYDFFKGLTGNNTEFPQVYNYYKINKTNLENSTIPDTGLLLVLNPQILKGYILGNIEEQEAKDIYNLFKPNFNGTIFGASLEIANYNISDIKPQEFIKKILNKKNLNGTIKVANYTSLPKNRVYSLMSFSDFNYENRIISEMFKQLSLEYGRTFVDTINQNKIYLRFTYFKGSNISYNNTLQLINQILEKIGEDQGKYKENIDVIGDRYYYMIKNMENEFSRNPNNMKDFSILYSYDQLYDMGDSKHYNIDKDDYKSFVESINQIFTENKYYYYEFSNE